MWKKPTPSAPSTSSPQAPQKSPETSPIARSEPRAHTSKSRIGAGMVIHGDVRGQEDLVVEGRVEGKIVLEHHTLVVESEGRVDAEISARVVRVAGEVRGNVTASEQAVLVESARLEGNITAPGVTIETGARFKGSVDMDGGASKTSSPVLRDNAAPAIPKPNGAAKPVGVA